jgi:hypothetical protein
MMLWACLRFWNHPRPWTAGEIGLYLGLATLTRSELVLLVLLIGVPLVFLVKGLSGVARWKQLGVMMVMVIVVIGPWVGRNMTTFHHPEYLSSEGGVTLATANCNAAYYGNTAGWWSIDCDQLARTGNEDESDIDHRLRAEARTYIADHASRVPTVVVIRLLRSWDLYRPIQQAQFDQNDARPSWTTELGTLYFYALVPFAIAGAVVLRRRHALLFPLVSLIVVATLAAALIYANGRYRTEGDLAVAILGGVGLYGAISRMRAFRPRAPGVMAGRR